MKRLLGVLGVVGLGLLLAHDAGAVLIHPNQAGLPNGSYETTAVTASGSSDAISGFTTGGVLYGVRLFAIRANASYVLYDAATAANSTTQGVFIDEGGEATQWDSYESIWPLPYVLVTGLSASVVNGNLTIYHDVRL